mmetsp:Transcript_1146/g.2737  ORF Transcript_1146/g.2737 Transcript_1146/m.2737 type:complete len:114 (-) Transcript_1146:1237-1578(-)
MGFKQVVIDFGAKSTLMTVCTLSRTTAATFLMYGQILESKAKLTELALFCAKHTALLVCSQAKLFHLNPTLTQDQRVCSSLMSLTFAHPYRLLTTITEPMQACTPYLMQGQRS